MTPDQIAKTGTESAIQKALFAYLAVARRWGWDCADRYGNGEALTLAEAMRDDDAIPELRWCFAVPNGGKRDAITAGRMKAEGVKAGVLDIFWPLKRGLYSGLWLEMKKPGCKLSPEQIDFIAHAEAQGYRCAVAYSWREAADIIRNYFEIGA